MNQEVVNVLQEDTLVFDVDTFNALSYSEQIEFILRKAAFIRKHILMDDPSLFQKEHADIYAH